MVIAKCTKCGGSAIGATFEEARKKINHAVALSRGKRCGDNYNMVVEVTPPVPTTVSTIPPSIQHTTVSTVPKTEKPKKKSESHKSSFAKEKEKMDNKTTDTKPTTETKSNYR